MFYPVDPSEKNSIHALRLGRYKAHFYTQGTVDESDPAHPHMQNGVFDYCISLFWTIRFIT